ncbi:hypothetical protein RC74_13220 [Falsihalocynthiibacter arcticus]|uniref:2Fe-2S ferredoxin-type domain-containing protein n=1 Tax=Falsihalocynthiibacter arcticus TaxID=1579316 RepID=A0A126V1A6_9RHOB|nr:hypothetical protein RC74_13220 [Falsihalocynthiibacter arcticus]
MIELFVQSVLRENLALTFFLGICTFLAVSKRVEIAFWLGIAMIVVQSITVPVNHLIFQGLLIEVLLGSVVFVCIVLLLVTVVLAARAFLMPAKNVTIQVNGRQEITAKTGNKLLTILSDGGVVIPSACGGAGTCGQCRAQVMQGRTPALQTETALLSRQDIAKGVRLACQTTLRDNISITLPESMLQAKSWVCQVVSSRSVAPLIREIVLDLPPPNRAELPPGIVSSWLFGCAEGDKVNMSGPFGTFAAQDSKREMVFIGGGVGMAPCGRSSRTNWSDKVPRAKSAFGMARAVVWVYFTNRNLNFYRKNTLIFIGPQHSRTPTTTGKAKRALFMRLLYAAILPHIQHRMIANTTSADRP